VDVRFVFIYKFPVMNFFVKNMFFDSMPFEVHFTEINSLKGEKLIVFKTDPQDDKPSLAIEKNRNEWRSVNASSVTALFFKNRECFPEQ